MTSSTGCASIWATCLDEAHGSQHPGYVDETCTSHSFANYLKIPGRSIAAMVFKVLSCCQQAKPRFEDPFSVEAHLCNLAQSHYPSRQHGRFPLPI
jgi:hypothetical protein